MSKEYCRKKIKYDKKGAITAKNNRMKEDHTALRVYPCDYCNGWHLTSQNPSLIKEDWAYKKYKKSADGKSGYFPFKKRKGRLKYQKRID